MSRYRAVFCDIDFTLTSPITRTIPESAKTAISKARENGILVFVATGRNLTAFDVKFLKELTFDGYVTVNGQLCYLPDGQILRKGTFEVEDVQAVMELEKKHGFHCSFNEQFETYLSGINAGVEAFFSFVNGSPPPIRLSSEIKPNEILSIVPFVREEMDLVLSQALPGCQILRWNPLSCDIAPRSGGKHVGIQVMLDYFGLQMRDCIAIGDGGNDVTMLRSAGMGVAVGGALEAAKAAADYIAPPVDEDAIEHIFRKFELIA